MSKAADHGSASIDQRVLPHQFALAVALVLAFIVYCETLAFNFVYDDRPQVVENPWIRSWRFAPHYFAMNVWGMHHPNELGNYYRPVFLLWLRVNNMFFGLKPWGWHLTSVLAHVAVTLLVYYLAAKLLRDRLSAAVAALIFGVHPVHIEAVAWVSGVTDPSMAALFISSFLCYFKAKEEGSHPRAWLALSLALFTLAMLAKETAIVLPLLIFSYEWIFGEDLRERGSIGTSGARLHRTLLSAAPYLALVPAYLFVRARAIGGIGHAITPLSFSTVVFTWPSLLWFYLKLLVWPVGLSPCYDTPYVMLPGLYNFLLPAAGVVGAVILLATWARRMPGPGRTAASFPNSKAIGFASAWLLVPMVPLLNLSLLPRGEIVHDRYLYLPSVGFAMIAALGIREIRCGQRKLLGQPAPRFVITLLVTLFLGWGTILQSLVWADDLQLYSRGVLVAPNNPGVKMNLANIACERGLYQAGIKLCKELIAQYPDLAFPYFRLGLTYYNLGRLEEADRYLKQCTDLDVFSAPAFLYLGLTRMKLGRLNEAESFLRHAVEVAPEGAPVYHFALATAVKAQGDLKGALEEFRAELLINPGEQAARSQIAELETRILDEALSPSQAPKPAPLPGNAPRHND